MDEEEITISLKEYEDLTECKVFLNALRNHGVDEWEGFYDAISQCGNNKE